MSGAKGEESHKLYKEEDGSHMRGFFGLLFVYGLFRLLAFFNYLVEIVEH